MNNPEEPADRLWNSYCQIFRDFDDFTLARWLSQTLSQFEGGLLRLSHPLVGTYRLAASVASDRQIWFKRLVTVPANYAVADCCQTPLLPMITRDVHESGLICIHCNETAIGSNHLPADSKSQLIDWARQYAEYHEVAHWDDRRKGTEEHYGKELEKAAQQASQLMAAAASDIFPALLEQFPSVVWEDHDECLSVRPDEIEPDQESSGI